MSPPPAQDIVSYDEGGPLYPVNGNDSTSINRLSMLSDKSMNEYTTTTSGSTSMSTTTTTSNNGNDGNVTELPIRVAIRVRPIDNPAQTHDVVVSPNSSITSSRGLMGAAGGPASPIPNGRLPASCIEVLSNKGHIKVSPPPPGSLSGSITGSTPLSSSASQYQGLPKVFPYDYTFGPQSKQTEVYDEAVKSLVDRFLEGFNITILAYGQTSSGKTYTMGTGMETSQESEGIVPRAINHIFKWVDAQKKNIKEQDEKEQLEANQQNGHNGDEVSRRGSIASPNLTAINGNSKGGRISRVLSTSSSSQYSTTSNTAGEHRVTHVEVKISYLEVYNEELIDLLASALGDYYRPPIVIREDAQGHIIWSGIKEVPINSASEAFGMLKDGSLVRQTGYTGMNEKSSRSHAIFSLYLVQHHTSATTGERTVITSKFHFVDLAGSERLKKTQSVGDRAKEGISINSGLLALGNVISALSELSSPSSMNNSSTISSRSNGGISHVPFRDSKLTRLLQDSLGGNSQTLLIACVSPASTNLSESISTLKYASRARKIKNQSSINSANVGTSEQEVEMLRQQVIRLHRELKELRAKAKENNNGTAVTNSDSANGFSNGPRSSILSDISFDISAIANGERRNSLVDANGDHQQHNDVRFTQLKSRNQVLEDELDNLNDAYTELLLKYNETCLEMEEQQCESFQREQKLRDKEREVRILSQNLNSSTSSQPPLSPVSNDGRPQSVSKHLELSYMASSILPTSHSSSTGTNGTSERPKSSHRLLMDNGSSRINGIGGGGGISGSVTNHVGNARPNSRRLSTQFFGKYAERNVSATSFALNVETDEDFNNIIEEYNLTISDLEDQLKNAFGSLNALQRQNKLQEEKLDYGNKAIKQHASQVDKLREQLDELRKVCESERERHYDAERQLRQQFEDEKNGLQDRLNEYEVKLKLAQEQNEDYEAKLKEAKLLEQQLRSGKGLRKTSIKFDQAVNTTTGGSGDLKQEVKEQQAIISELQARLVQRDGKIIAIQKENIELKSGKSVVTTTTSREATEDLPFIGASASTPPTTTTAATTSGTTPSSPNPEQQPQQSVRKVRSYRAFSARRSHSSLNQQSSVTANGSDLKALEKQLMATKASEAALREKYQTISKELEERDSVIIDISQQIQTIESKYLATQRKEALAQSKISDLECKLQRSISTSSVGVSTGDRVISQGSIDGAQEGDSHSTSQNNATKGVESQSHEAMGLKVKRRSLLANANTIGAGGIISPVSTSVQQNNKDLFNTAGPSAYETFMFTDDLAIEEVHKEIRRRETVMALAPANRRACMAFAQSEAHGAHSLDPLLSMQFPDPPPSVPGFYRNDNRSARSLTWCGNIKSHNGANNVQNASDHDSIKQSLVEFVNNTATVPSVSVLNDTSEKGKEVVVVSQNATMVANSTSSPLSSSGDSFISVEDSVSNNNTTHHKSHSKDFKTGMLETTLMTKKLVEDNKTIEKMNKHLQEIVKDLEAKVAKLTTEKEHLEKSAASTGATSSTDVVGSEEKKNDSSTAYPETTGQDLGEAVETPPLPNVSSGLKTRNFSAERATLRRNGTPSQLLLGAVDESDDDENASGYGIQNENIFGGSVNGMKSFCGVGHEDLYGSNNSIAGSNYSSGNYNNNKRTTSGGPLSMLGSPFGSGQETLIARLEQERDQLDNQVQYYKILVEEQQSRLGRQETALHSLQAKLEKTLLYNNTTGGGDRDSNGHTVMPSQSTSKLFARVNSTSGGLTNGNVGIRRPSTESMSRTRSNPHILYRQRSENRVVQHHKSITNIDNDSTEHGIGSNRVSISSSQLRPSTSSEPKRSIDSTVHNASIGSFTSTSMLGRTQSLVRSLRPSIDEASRIHRNTSIESKRSLSPKATEKKFVGNDEEKEDGGTSSPVLQPSDTPNTGGYLGRKHLSSPISTEALSQNNNNKPSEGDSNDRTANSDENHAVEGDEDNNHQEEDNRDPIVILSELEQELERSEELLQQHRDKTEQLEEELESHKQLIATLEESLTNSEAQMEKYKQEVESYSQEVLRSHSETKSLRENLERMKFQLADAKSTSDAEARDRDMWKSKCQDLQEELQERRMLSRRKSKMLCF
ncbi:hypothetical protein H4219_001271 [Mycoemilia scoparia]|uniref:Kinesin motor domain-containing protein n=1 Tax=Mycoemilia scoparia TaxID=417184 RepID=A0A9W8A8R1_9FUNG|nr:hypothetical protein H4219_001271 [Mycoemilia scoparia]